MDLTNLAERLEGFITEIEEKRGMSTGGRPLTYFEGRKKTLLQEFETARQSWRKCRALKVEVIKILNEI